MDDVLNVSGHRLGTAEIEGAIGAHECVAEAAVVGYPHSIKGQGIYAYITLMTGKNENNITTKRPGSGLSAKYYFHLIGKKSKFFYDKDKLIKKLELNK